MKTSPGPRLRLTLLIPAVAAVAVCLPAPARAQYEIIPSRPPVRWGFWLSDGPAEVLSSNNSLGNRFQLGGEGQFGPSYRFIVGITAIDLLSSGESSSDVGNISRYGFDLRIGLFLVPDSLFIEYGLYLGEIHGSGIFGWNTVVGHGVGLGWRFYADERVNLALEASYQFMGSQTVQTFSPSTGAFGTSTYPRANVYSLSVRAGFDLGG